MVPDSATAEVEPTGQPLQFSLRTLLIVMTVAAIFLSGLFGGTDWIAMATAYVLFTAWPMVLAIVLVYGRGRARTFCIGALIPTVPLLVSPSSILFALAFGTFGPGTLGLEERLRLGLACLVMLVTSIFCGVAALGVRRLVESSARPEKTIATANGAMEEIGRST